MNKFKLEGKAVRVKHKVTPSGKQLVEVGIEALNDAGYKSIINCVCWHDGQNNEHLLSEGQVITAVGNLRNVKSTNRNGEVVWRLEPTIEQFKTSLTEVANDQFKTQPAPQPVAQPASKPAIKPTRQSYPFDNSESSITESDLPF